MELAGPCHCLPFLWAVVPLTVEDSIVPTIPEVGGMNFPLPAMASVADYFSNPTLRAGRGLARPGRAGLGFLLHLSPGAGCLISSGQTGWTLSLPSSFQPVFEKTPDDFYKGVLWGRIRTVLTPNLLSFLKKGKSHKAHTVSTRASLSPRGVREEPGCEAEAGPPHQQLLCLPPSLPRG